MSIDEFDNKPPSRPSAFDFSQLISPQLREQLSELGKSIATKQQWAQDIAAQVSERMQETLAPMMEKLKEVASELGRFYPTNWDDADNQLAIAELMVSDGYCLVWVPSPEVVHAMVIATGRDERDLVLEVRSAEIMQSVRSELARCDESALRDVREAVEEASRVFEHGDEMAAQTLASSSLTHIAQSYLAHIHLADAKNTWLFDDIEELGFGFRLELLGGCLSRALERTTEGLPGFNRHATAHGVYRSNYSTANCLNAIMLATAWLREIQSEFDYQRRRAEANKPQSLTNVRPVVRLRTAAKIEADEAPRDI